MEKKYMNVVLLKNLIWKDGPSRLGDKFRDRFKLDITENGLYWETPDIIDTESRGYLWCPAKVEGDQWIEFEFQLVSPKGLALVMMCASGSQG